MNTAFNPSNADEESELAGVMAHEIAHVAARHATRQMTRAQWANIGTIPLIFVGGGIGYAVRSAAALGLPLTFLSFSRDGHSFIYATEEGASNIARLTLDPRTGKPVPMSTLEFRLLYFLAARPNRVFTRDQLLDAVWGTERFVTPRSVDVYVRRLREKIELDPQHPVFMKTIRGAGYLFETRAS